MNKMRKSKNLSQDNHIKSNLSGIEIKRAQLLSKYFILRGNCSLDQDSNDNHQFFSYCPPTSDYLLCFPRTTTNSTIHLPCPYRNYQQTLENNGKFFKILLNIFHFIELIFK
jgi:hypothetical protein